MDAETGELTPVERAAVVDLLERSIEQIEGKRDHKDGFTGAPPGVVGTWGTVSAVYQSALRKLRR